MTTENVSKTWGEFNAALEAHFGTLKRAQTNFCENSRFSLSSLQHWRKSDKVPNEAFVALNAIDTAQFKSTPPKKERLSPAVNDRVVELSAQNKTLGEIAEILSQELSRPINENMIKGIRYRNKDRIDNYRSRNSKGE